MQCTIGKLADERMFTILGNPTCRDKLRRQLAEALQLAAGDVPDADPGTIAAEVEAAVLRQNGAVNPKYKAKIRSVWVNLKDPSNPDFRRSVLSGEVTGERSQSLGTCLASPSSLLASSETSSQMASDPLSVYRCPRCDTLGNETRFVG